MAFKVTLQSQKQKLMSESKKYRCVLLFGAPGTGKGTQGGILGHVPGFYHLAVGDVFRSIDINSPTGKEVHKYVSKGQLVPDDLTIKIWKNALEAYIALSTYKPWEDLLILDGLPRNLEQANLIDNELEVLKVVHLDCEDEEDMIRRIQKRAIQSNRADDAQESVIRHRFEVYRSVSAPVLEFYPDDIISQVEASGSPAEVLQRILKAVIPAQNFCFNNPW